MNLKIGEREVTFKEVTREYFEPYFDKIIWTDYMDPNNPCYFDGGPDPLFLVAEVDRQFTGYATLWKPFMREDKSDNYGQLNFLEVIEEYRRNGIATELVKKLYEITMEAGGTTLDIFGYRHEPTEKLVEKLQKDGLYPHIDVVE